MMGVPVQYPTGDPTQPADYDKAASETTRVIDALERAKQNLNYG